MMTTIKLGELAMVDFLLSTTLAFFQTQIFALKRGANCHLRGNTTSMFPCGREHGKGGNGVVSSWDEGPSL